MKPTEPKDSYYLGKEERVDTAYFHFLAGFSMTLDNLAKAMNVSKTTLKNSLPFVRNMIATYFLNLDYIAKTGLIVTGEEREIRKALLDFLYLNCEMTAAVDGEVSISFNHLNPCLCGFVREVVTPCAIAHGVHILSSLNKNLSIKNDEIYFIGLLKLIILFWRSKNGNFLPKNVAPRVNKNALASSEELTAIVSRRFECSLSPRELDDFIVILKKDFLINDAEFDEVRLIGIQILIQRTIYGILTESLSDDLIIDKRFNPEIEYAQEMLFAHMYKAIERLRTNIRISNPYLANIKTKHSDLFALTSQGLLKLEALLGKRFSEGEIGYVTLLIENLISAVRRSMHKVKNIVIVCGAGAGISEIVRQKISRIFDVNIKNVIPHHKLKEILKDRSIDLIVSTIDLHPSEHTSHDAIAYVSPLITAADVEILANLGMKEKTFELLPDFAKLMSIIEANCDILDKNKLETELRGLSGYTKDAPNKYEALLGLINKNAIALNQNAATWQDAITLTGGLLYKNGNIDYSYIDAMIENVEKLGPYIILGKNIALPHAENIGNVHKSGFSLITLATPVFFENNSAADIIICFCAKEKSDVSEALVAMIELIDYYDIFKSRSIKTSQDVMDYIKNLANS
ncbi:MAG: PTS sugar transporter subunit IIA [Defluviitaleaceae bacterium]|nr:PTS sugar transporter subunit IIA [Defluviitaleaceae bacterium]